MVSATWNSLPTEMRLAVVDALDDVDIKSLAKVNQSTYQACVPSVFKSITLTSNAALENFIQNVPRTYFRFIKQLGLTMSEVTGAATTEAIIALLLASPCLHELTIEMHGSLHSSVIPCFSHLPEVTHLTLKNTADEKVHPLSERLVVSIAASIPNLQYLSLDRVSRSLVHAPELDGVYPYIPLVSGDEHIPDHPTLGNDLYLPSLLRLPSLKSLVIRDTHLGDARWSSVPVACHLQVLDLGSCDYETESTNTACIERIMAAVGRTVDEFSLMTSVSDAIFSERRATPLPSLRKLHISPFFPVDSVVDTISNLAGSPIESLSMQCYEDDVVDVCAALEEFLSVRVARGGEFFDKLKRIDVSVAASDLWTKSSAPTFADEEEASEREAATQRLQDFCRDLRLASQVRMKAEAAIWASTTRSGILRTSGLDGRVRAMTM